MPALLFFTTKQKGDAMKWCVIIIAMLALGLQAKETGNLKGVVIDPEGNPAVGATVRVIGTPRGAITKSDGIFLIVGVDVGKWDIQATLIGSEPATQKIDINANKTSSLTFNLSADEIILDEVAVVAEKMVDLKSVGSSSNLLDFTSPSNNSASRSQKNRSSRKASTQIRVDGMDVSDKFTGGFGSIGNTYYPGVSQQALDNLKVKTNGLLRNNST